jgi:hypothetical protein
MLQNIKKELRSGLPFLALPTLSSPAISTLPYDHQKHFVDVIEYYATTPPSLRIPGAKKVETGVCNELVGWTRRVRYRTEGEQARARSQAGSLERHHGDFKNS